MGGARRGVGGAEAGGRGARLLSPPPNPARPRSRRALSQAPPSALLKAPGRPWVLPDCRRTETLFSGPGCAPPSVLTLVRPQGAESAVRRDSHAPAPLPVPAPRPAGGAAPRARSLQWPAEVEVRVSDPSSWVQIPGWGGRSSGLVLRRRSGPGGPGPTGGRIQRSRRSTRSFGGRRAPSPGGETEVRRGRERERERACQRPPGEPGPKPQNSGPGIFI